MGVCTFALFPSSCSYPDLSEHFVLFNQFSHFIKNILLHLFVFGFWAWGVATQAFPGKHLELTCLKHFAVPPKPWPGEPVHTFTQQKQQQQQPAAAASSRSRSQQQQQQPAAAAAAAASSSSRSQQQPAAAAAAAAAAASSSQPQQQQPAAAASSSSQQQQQPAAAAASSSSSSQQQQQLQLSFFQHGRKLLFSCLRRFGRAFSKLLLGAKLLAAFPGSNLELPPLI